MRFLALLILVTLGSVITLLRGKQNKQPLKKQFVTWPSENHTSHFHQGGNNEVPVQNNKSPHQSLLSPLISQHPDIQPLRCTVKFWGQMVFRCDSETLTLYQTKFNSAAFCTLYQTKDQQSLPCPRLASFQKYGHYNKTKQNKIFYV